MMKRFEVSEIVGRWLKVEGFSRGKGQDNFRLGQGHVIPEVEMVNEHRRTGIAVGVVLYAVFVARHTRL